MTQLKEVSVKLAFYCMRREEKRREEKRSNKIRFQGVIVMCNPIVVLGS